MNRCQSDLSHSAAHDPISGSAPVARRLSTAALYFRRGYGQCLTD
jgi:hypothetical protein